MPTPDEMKAAMSSYLEMLTATDVDGMVALFSEEGSMEDPVGTEPHRGHAALAAFFGGAAPMLTAEIAGPICSAGEREVAAVVLARLTVGEGVYRYIDAIDVMKFDASGKIESLRAFWNPADMRETPQR